MTRVLFFYLNAAVARWESGASVEEVDAPLREFGWPMGPLRLIDEVGVDVTADRYQLRAPGREPPVEMTRKRVGTGWRVGPGGSQRAALGQRQRTRHVGFSI